MSAGSYSKLEKTHLLGYESTQSPNFDFDHRGPSLSVVKKIFLDFKKQGDVEALKNGCWGGGNIEGTLKTVDFEKILSRTYLGRMYLKFHT